VLLALSVAIVCCRSFPDFLKANVFHPLGMNHTPVYDASRPALHKLAQMYLLAPSRGLPASSPEIKRVNRILGQVRAQRVDALRISG
jgi:CubicO group peptidase (beta-lactamase class C family)